MKPHAFKADGDPFYLGQDGAPRCNAVEDEVLCGQMGGHPVHCSAVEWPSNAELWTCTDCGFGFAAIRQEKYRSLVCPLCSLIETESERDEARDNLDRLLQKVIAFERVADDCGHHVFVAKQALFACATKITDQRVGEMIAKKDQAGNSGA